MNNITVPPVDMHDIVDDLNLAIEGCDFGVVLQRR
jgi:hypothetical protein